VVQDTPGIHDVEASGQGWLLATSPYSPVELHRGGLLDVAGGGVRGGLIVGVPGGVASLPTLGRLVVAGDAGLRVYISRDAFAMDRVSITRMSWMVAVARAILAKPTVRW
jgi:hypothetical protein